MDNRYLGDGGEEMVKEYEKRVDLWGVSDEEGLVMRGEEGVIKSGK